MGVECKLRTKTFRFIANGLDNIDNVVNYYIEDIYDKQGTIEKVETLISADGKMVFKVITYYCKEIV